MKKMRIVSACKYKRYDRLRSLSAIQYCILFITPGFLNENFLADLKVCVKKDKKHKSLEHGIYDVVMWENTPTTLKLF